MNFHLGEVNELDHIVWVVLDGNWKFKFGEEGLKRMLLPFYLFAVDYFLPFRER